LCSGACSWAVGSLFSAVFSACMRSILVEKWDATPPSPAFFRHRA
jgi:hypothetical protein